jgi:hypothetical protein
MLTENLNVKQIIEDRRHAVTESLRPMSVSELRTLKDEIFPFIDHPWLEKFSEVVNDPSSGKIYHAMADYQINVLYCPNRNIGMWFIRKVGKGPLRPENLKMMQEIVESKP